MSTPHHHIFSIIVVTTSWIYNRRTTTTISGSAGQVPNCVEKAMNELAALTGRQYSLFDYHGCEDAEHVVVCMGMAAITVAETVAHLVIHRGMRVR